jgi:hypothetical protein
MADIRDWGKFIRGRWDWTAGGYEKGFPRGCQFTDVDAATEFDSQFLLIETKHHDGTGIGMEYPDTGQLMALRAEVRLGKTVFILYGCGPCNSPQALRILGYKKPDDVFIDWRNIPSIEERRKLLKYQIDLAQGLVEPEPVEIFDEDAFG